MGLLDVFKKAEKKVEEVKKDVDTLAQEVMKGEWGSKEEDIIKKLKEAGYENYTEIKAKVDTLVKKAEDAKKQAEAAAKAAAEAAKAKLEANRKAKIEELAKEVIQGKWGNGQERYDKICDLIEVGTDMVVPLDLWRLSADSLSRHPYIRSVEVAKSIVLYRENAPQEKWTIEALEQVGILSKEDASRLRKCIIKAP